MSYSDEGLTFCASAPYNTYSDDQNISFLSWPTNSCSDEGLTFETSAPFPTYSDDQNISIVRCLNYSCSDEYIIYTKGKGTKRWNIHVHTKKMKWRKEKNSQAGLSQQQIPITVAPIKKQSKYYKNYVQD